jgi:phosphoglycolate phosphatase
LRSFDLFVFDFDGTLADSRLSISNSFNFALREYGLAEVKPGRIYTMIGKQMLDEMFLSFYPEIELEQIPALLECFRQYQRENVLDELLYFPEVISTIASLKARGKSLAILSNKSQKQLEHGLGAFNLLDSFQIVLGSGFLNETKPAKACMDYIWQALPAEASRTVMIGDSEVDVLTARNAGIELIAVSHGTDSAESLLTMGAAYSVENFSEILNFA